MKTLIRRAKGNLTQEEKFIVGDLSFSSRKINKTAKDRKTAELTREKFLLIKKYERLQKRNKRLLKKFVLNN